MLASAREADTARSIWKIDAALLEQRRRRLKFRIFDGEHVVACRGMVGAGRRTAAFDGPEERNST
jgi:hypothetical protein